MDLGYYNFLNFHRLASHGATFLTRVKTNCALTIVENLSPGSGRRAKLEGMTVSQALAKTRRKYVEWMVEVPVTLRSGRELTYRWRVLAQRNDESGEYHVYMTNAPSELISVEDVGELYALRWQIDIYQHYYPYRLHHLLKFRHFSDSRTRRPHCSRPPQSEIPCRRTTRPSRAFQSANNA